MNEFLNPTTHYNNNKMCKYTTITKNNNNKNKNNNNNSNNKKKTHNMRLPKGIGGLSHHLLFVMFIIMIQQIQFLPGCSALVFMMTPPSLTDNIAAATVPENSQILTAMTQTNMNLTTDVAATAPAASAAITSTPISTNSPPSPQRRPPPRVVLNKCCLFGEYLDKTKTCVAGSSELWIPLIYLINRKKHHEPSGTAPKFITFEDNIFPISRARNINEIVRNSTEDEVTCTVEDLEFVTGNHNIVLFSNGSLFLPEKGISLPPARYCVDQQAALVCFPKSRENLPTLKLKKCCGPHGAYDDEMKKCHIDAGHKRKLSISHLEENEYQTIYGFPECKTGSTAFAIAGDWEASQLYTESGHLHLPTHKVNLTSSDYCLEYLRTNNGSSDSLKIFACLHHFGPEDEYAISDRRQNAALSFGLVISVVFLAATLVASYLMPSVHHVLHWRCQIYYVFCLFIAELLLAWIQLSKTMVLHEALCNLVASTMHFFFLSAFFWLNTMCFNIWWTFRDFRPSSLERNQELIRLRLYSAYAWGIPLLIATIAACVNLIPESSLLRPGFGDINCWFSGERLSIFAYFFGPIGILFSINIMLFVSTTHQLTCGLWKRDDVKSTTEKTALGKVCLKLVVVMGVTWIVDVISWIVGGPQCWWFVTDFINAIQGVFIFLVVGCQPQVWAACKRFCCPRSRGEITNTTNGVQHSSSSQGLPSMAACGGEITQNTSVANTTMNGGSSSGVHNTSAIAKIPMETVC